MKNSSTTTRTHIDVSSGRTHMTVSLPGSNPELTTSLLNQMTGLIQKMERNCLENRLRKRQDTREYRQNKKQQKTQDKLRQKHQGQQHKPQWKLGLRMVKGMDISNPTALTAMAYADLYKYYGNTRDTNRVWRSSTRV